MNIQILSAARTDIGPRKELNEDSYYYSVGDGSGSPAGIFVVADGVSGSFHGEVASRMSVKAVEYWWRTVFPTLERDKNKAIPSMAQTIIELNESVCAARLEEGGRSASTLTLLLLLNGEWFTFNVGDSRVYRLRRGLAGRIEQITVDQSCLVEREYNGEKYLKSVLTSCIGGRNTFRYEFSSGSLRRGDRFLLCSDGIYKTAPLKQLQKTLGAARATPEQVCEKLVHSALDNGETDNITAIAVFC